MLLEFLIYLKHRLNSPKSKFYQASSSKIFGRSVEKNGYQRETTKFEPTSPYGCTKVFAYNLVKHYRNAYKLSVLVKFLIMSLKERCKLCYK